MLNENILLNKAIFIDKDGTLIPDIPFNISPNLISLNPNLTDGLRSLSDAGFLIVIISNQSGVAHGYFTCEQLTNVKIRIEELLHEQKIALHGFYFCPHHPNGRVKEFATVCNCRKPAPGLFGKAANELKIDLAQSWMIGDILNDVEAGKRAGCNTILINNGNETEWVINAERTPDFTANTINEAALYILKHQVNFNICD